MINEAANVVDEGIAMRPLNVDQVSLYGYGFPRYQGGPMKYADKVGLDTVLTNINGYADDDGVFWKASPLLEKSVNQGKDFSSLNSA